MDKKQIFKRIESNAKNRNIIRNNYYVYYLGDIEYRINVFPDLINSGSYRSHIRIYRENNLISHVYASSEDLHGDTDMFEDHLNSTETELLFLSR